MKKMLQFGCVAAFLLWAAMPARAQASVVCKGPVDSCARATDAVRLYLALQTRDAGAAAHGWRFALLDEAAWTKIAETFREEATLEKITGSAFTVAALRTTYIHLGWFSAQLPSRQFETVVHELAHITVCAVNAQGVDPERSRGAQEACAIRETQQRLRALGAIR